MAQQCKPEPMFVLFISCYHLNWHPCIIQRERLAYFFDLFDPFTLISALPTWGWDSSILICKQASYFKINLSEYSLTKKELKKSLHLGLPINKGPVAKEKLFAQGLHIDWTNLCSSGPVHNTDRRMQLGEFFRSFAYQCNPQFIPSFLQRKSFICS